MSSEFHHYPQLNTVRVYYIYMFYDVYMCTYMLLHTVNLATDAMLPLNYVAILLYF